MTTNYEGTVLTVVDHRNNIVFCHKVLACTQKVGILILAGGFAPAGTQPGHRNEGHLSPSKRIANQH